MSLRPLFIAVLLLIAPAGAFAHKSAITRRLLFEATHDRLYVIANVRVPSGKHRTALLALADVNRNGKIEDPERRELEVHLAQRALFGVMLFAGTSTVVLGGAETKLNIPPDEKSGLEMMLLGSAPLPAGRVAVRVATIKTAEPLEIELVPGKRPALQVSRGKLEKGRYRTTLGPLDQVSWELSSAGSDGR